MGLFINTNTTSLNSQRQLNATSRSLKQSFERLSSGLRINGAKDDAAGLSISTRIGAQVEGLNQAVRNSNDGISLMQTAEGALNETTQIVQRMRELSVQSANMTNNDGDRASLQAEVAQLKAEIDRIAETTNFNGNKVLDGNFLMRDLQVGANVGETISVSIAGAATTDLARQARYTSDIPGQEFVDGAALPPNGLNITNERGAFDIRESTVGDDVSSTTLQGASAIAKAAAINDSARLSGVRAIVGDTEVTLSNVVAGGTLNTGSYIVLNDEKIAGFTVTQNDASGELVDAINAVSEETGVVASMNASSQLTLTAQDGRNIELQYEGNARTIIGAGGAIGAIVNDANVTVATADITLQSDENFEILGGGPQIGFLDGLYGVNSTNSVNSVDISTRQGAVTAIDTLDLALADISSTRADLGALQNRLESTVNNLSTTAENLSSSLSRIQDADFAVETAQLSRNQIIQQAGVSMLAQANQLPQIALSLLS